MKRYKFLTVLLSLALIVPLSAHAQYEEEEPRPQPVKDEREVKQKLFEIDSRGINHYFKAALPGDNFMIIELEKMSYYPGPKALQEIIDKTAETIAAVQDSFKHASASRRIDIHLPVKNEPVTVRIKEHTDGSDLVVLSNKQQAPLKIGMDTIRVLKNFEERKGKQGTTIARVQYTFLLKDARQIQDVQKNTVLIDDIATSFDTEVNKQRAKWANEDTWYHALNIDYNPKKEKKDEKLTVKKEPGLLRGFGTDVGIGISLFRNTLAPRADIGYSYKWPTSLDEYGFVRVSLSAFYLFDNLPNNDVKMYGVAFVNAEAGSLLNKKNTIIPVYQVSMGLGYKIEGKYTRGYNPTRGDIYRLFFNYSISRAFTVTPEFYYQPSLSEESRFFTGLTLTLKLF